MSTAAGLLLGAFLILLSLTYLGVHIPALVLGVFALLAGVMVIIAGVPVRVSPPN